MNPSFEKSALTLVLLPQAFLHLCGLAGTLPQIVKLRPADLPKPNHLDILYVRGVQWPGLLHAYAVGDFPDGEGLPVSSALALEDGALKNLDTLSAPFFDQGMDPDSVSYPEVGDGGFHLGSFDVLDDFVHVVLPFWLYE